MEAATRHMLEEQLVSGDSHRAAPGPTKSLLSANDIEIGDHKHASAIKGQIVTSHYDKRGAITLPPSIRHVQAIEEGAHF